MNESCQRKRPADVEYTGMGGAVIVRRNTIDPEPHDWLDKVLVAFIRLLTITSDMPELSRV